MKKAILVTGIIWAVLCLVGAIMEIIVAIPYFTGIKGDNVQINPDVALGVGNLILAAWLIAGTVLAFVLIAKRNSAMKKVPGILLGVFAAVFGATVPGVLFAIDSGINRPRE